MKRLINWLAGIGYATIFGFSFFMTKGALDILDPLELMFLRFSIAALALSALWGLGVLRLDFRHAHVGHLAMTCLFQPILYFLCETYGVKESASSMAGIVIGAIPASVAILGSVMLKERLSLGQKLSLALSIAGVALIVAFSGASGAQGGTIRGFVLLLGAVAAASLFNIYSRKTSRGLRPLETTFAMMWTGAIFFGITNLVAKALVGAGGSALPRAALIPRAAEALPSLLYLGLMSSIVAFFLINFTLSRLKASQSAVFTNLTTLVSVGAGVLIRHEPFGPVQVLGAVMIIFGVWGTNALSAGREQRPPRP
jgi:drug/metabolite transporter (DMT)-like permease